MFIINSWNIGYKNSSLIWSIDSNQNPLLYAYAYSSCQIHSLVIFMQYFEAQYKLLNIDIDNLTLNFVIENEYQKSIITRIFPKSFFVFSIKKFIDDFVQSGFVSNCEEETILANHIKKYYLENYPKQIEECYIKDCYNELIDIRKEICQISYEYYLQMVNNYLSNINNTERKFTLFLSLII